MKGFPVLPFVALQEGFVLLVGSGEKEVQRTAVVVFVAEENLLSPYLLQVNLHRQSAAERVTVRVRVRDDGYHVGIVNQRIEG